MHTEIVNFQTKESDILGVKHQIKMRDCKLNDWLTDPFLSDRLSGTIKKNAKLGMKYVDQLRHEALCQTLGWTWESVQSSYLTFNDAITEGDCHAITESGWFADRWIALKMFREEHYECKYIIVDTPEGRREGIGLICRQTLIQWCQPGSIIFCILAEYDYKNKKWLEAQNPF
jgi:cytidine deaminase